MSKLTVILKLAIRDAFVHRSEFFLLVSVLSFVAFALQSSVVLKNSLAVYINKQSQSFLTADLEITSLSPFSANRIQELSKQLQAVKTATVTEVMTHVVAGKHSAMAMIKAVDEFYPLVGPAVLSPVKNGAIVSPDLLESLQIQIGQTIQIGDLKIAVAGEMQKEIGAPRFGLTQAPPLYIAQIKLKDSGLIAPGSQVYYRCYFLAPLLSDTERSKLEKSGYFVRTAKDSVMSIEKGLKLAIEAMDVAILFVLSVCLIIALYGFQAILKKRQNIFIWLSYFSATRTHIFAYSMVLSFVVVQVSVLIAFCMLNAAIIFQKCFLPFLFPEQFHLLLTFNSLLQIEIIVFFFAMILAVINISNLWSMAIALLIVIGFATMTLPHPRMIALLSVSLLASWILAILSPIIFARLLKASFVKGAILRLSIRNISRPGVVSVLLFQAFFIGLFAQVTFVHLSSSLRSELTPDPSQTPQYFLTNVQKDDLQNVQSVTQKLGGRFEFPAPLFLGRLVKINNQPVESDSFQKFPLRMTESNRLKSSETIVAGQPLDSKDAVSIEVEFAQRNDLHIGDLLEFELQGLPVRGQIRQLRHIEWTKFEPNFFIQFYKGALSDFPNSWIGIVRGLPNANKVLYQQQIAKFGSLFDIAKILNRLTELLDRIRQPIEFFLSLLVALSVGFSMLLIGHHVRSRRFEIAILELCGATRQKKLRYFIYEYGLIITLSFVLSQIGGSLAARQVAKNIFKIPFIPDYFTTLSFGCMTALLCLVSLSLLLHSVRDVSVKELIS